MKNRYGRHFTTSTPQYQRIPETNQVQNRAGGWAFPVTDEIQAERFLILGTSENTYYASARELTREAATCIDRLLEDGKGLWLVNKIAEISDSGRAPKNDPAIFALAMCLKADDTDTRRAAAGAAPSICRTATHWAQLAEMVKIFSHVRKDDKGEHYAWPRVTKRAFTNLLNAKTDDQLAYQMIKYRSREGWSLRDILRRAKPKPSTGARNLLYSYAVNRDKVSGWEGLPDIILAFEEVQKADTAAEVVKLVQDHRLPWEAIPSKWARDLDVQYALFLTMPITATIRQLGRLTNIGLLTPGSDATRTAIARVTNAELLRRGRVHPMNLYLAEEVYAVGRGIRGGLTWNPVAEIVDALGQAFFQSFGTVQPTGKTIVVGVDISGSMSDSGANLRGGVMGIPGFQCVEAAFASAFALMRMEPNCRGVLFDTAPRTFALNGIESIRQLKERARVLWQHGGGTDCSVPIVYAHQHWSDVDAFVIYTDNETWRGTIHPIEALWQYRRHWNRPARLVTQAFTPTGHSIVPADDAEVLDVAGMDDSAPQIITDFLR